MTDISEQTEDTPQIQRHRHELRRRDLTVTARQQLTPRMIRITVAGEGLEDFPSVAFDDHVKLRFGGEEMRDYTPRAFDRKAGTLVLDFAVHDAGPATAWAIDAQVGDALWVAGPRGSATIGGKIARWLLIGDETALPAMGRFAEEAAPGAQVDMIGLVHDAAEEQAWDSAADLSVTWVHRGDAVTDPAPAVAALPALPLAPGTFVWIAAEAGVARALREALLAGGHPLTWLKARGYWTAGSADTTENF